MEKVPMEIAETSPLAARGLPPERTCIITREAKPKEALLRFVVSPEGKLFFDASEKLPGRGIYVSCSRLLVAEAIAKRAFSRAAERQVAIPEGFLEQMETQMLKRATDALSLTRKAGQVITGFEKVETAVKQGNVAVLLHASDAGEDGVKKLRDGEVPTFRLLPRALLSQALGRENAVHVAVLRGKADAFFLNEMRRFALFME